MCCLGRLEFDRDPHPQNYRNMSLPQAGNEQIEQAAALLAAADRPVIVAGGGIKNTNGDHAAIALAESLNAPIVTSPGHGDAIPFGHPLNAGQMGPRGNAVASRLVKEADVILALGTRLGFNSTFYSYDNINRDAAIIQIEIEPTAIGRFFPVALGIWGDAPGAARALAASAEKIQRRAAADAWTAGYKDERAAFLAKRDQDAVETDPIQPSGLFKAFRQVFPDNAAVTFDAGTLCLQGTDALVLWRAKKPVFTAGFWPCWFFLCLWTGVKLSLARTASDQPDG